MTKKIAFNLTIIADVPLDFEVTQEMVQHICPTLQSFFQACVNEQVALAQEHPPIMFVPKPIERKNEKD